MALAGLAASSSGSGGTCEDRHGRTRLSPTPPLGSRRPGWMQRGVFQDSETTAALILRALLWEVHIPMLGCRLLGAAVARDLTLRWPICYRWLFVKNMSNICQKYVKHMSKTCQKYVKNMLKICQTYPQNIPNICQKYPPKMLTKIPKICQAYVKKHVKNIPKISKKLFQKYTKNEKKNKYIKK